MCGQHLVSYILQCVLPWGLTEAPSDLSCSSRGQLRIRELPGAGDLTKVPPPRIHHQPWPIAQHSHHLNITEC